MFPHFRRKWINSCIFIMKNDRSHVPQCCRPRGRKLHFGTMTLHISNDKSPLGWIFHSVYNNKKRIFYLSPPTPHQQSFNKICVCGRVLLLFNNQPLDLLCSWRTVHLVGKLQAHSVTASLCSLSLWSSSQTSFLMALWGIICACIISCHTSMLYCFEISSIWLDCLSNNCRCLKGALFWLCRQHVGELLSFAALL